MMQIYYIYNRYIVHIQFAPHTANIGETKTNLVS